MTPRTALVATASLVVAVAAGVVLTGGNSSDPEPVSGVPAPAAPTSTLPRDIPVTDITAPEGVYDPIAAGETVPDGYRVSLGRDWIKPVYNPTFMSAEDTEWPADSLVIGVEIDGDARAYPVSYLSLREMVIDDVANIPVLVSW